MKKLLLVFLLFTVVANANVLQSDILTLQPNVKQFSPIKTNSSVQNLSSAKYTDITNTYSLVTKGVLSVVMLTDTSDDIPKAAHKQNGNANKELHTSNEMPMRSAWPLLAAAIILFCLGANRRRV